VRHKVTIRTVRELPGRADVSTTMIDTHVIRGKGKDSPADISIVSRQRFHLLLDAESAAEYNKIDFRHGLAAKSSPRPTVILSQIRSVQ
jgi:hypothetical protein